MSHRTAYRNCMHNTAAVIKLLLVCIFCATLSHAAPSAQETAPTVVIHNPEQFNSHLEELALQMQPRTTCVFRKPALLNARGV